MSSDDEYRKMLAASNAKRNPLIRKGGEVQVAGKPIMKISEGGPKK